LFWLEPSTRDAEVISSAMQHLYHVLFGPESGHRVTFLAQRYAGSNPRSTAKTGQ